MVPESVESPVSLYVIAAVLLIGGVIAAAIGTQIKRRIEEEHRDERYVREKRGEVVLDAEPPRIAGLLQRAGGIAVAVGIVVLVLGWTLTPGPS
jgi:hypothetical protein